MVYKDYLLFCEDSLFLDDLRLKMDNRPVGIFDSGYGGITFLKTAVEILPNEDFVYFGDNKNAPYGKREESEIQKLSLNCAKTLVDRNVKAIVVACNTATSASISILRETFNIPILSMEPAIKPALESYKDGNIVVLATCGTIALKRYNKLVEKLDLHHRVVNVACPGLVEIIEKVDYKEQEIFDYFDEHVLNHIDDDTCAFVLGCTHYMHVKGLLKKYVQDKLKADVKIYDGNMGTARQLKKVLSQNNLLNGENESQSVEFLSSASDEVIEKMKISFDRYRL